MLLDNQIRLYRLPVIRTHSERVAKRSRKIFDEDPGAIKSALMGWAALNNCKTTVLSKIIKMSDVVHFPKGYRFITYKGQGDDVFIIIQGDALVKTPNGKLPIRRAVTTLGEKKAMDRHAHRTAHVYAKSEIVALKMSGADFRSLRKSCRTFEQNIDRDMRDRHTEAGLPSKKSNQWYVSLSAASLAIAFGVLTTNQMNDPVLGFVVGLGVFGLALYFMSKFVLRAALTVVAWLLLTFQLNAQIDSTGQSIAQLTTTQPSTIAVLSATFIATVMLIVGSMKS